MPSEGVVLRVLHALERRRAVYHDAVATAHDELRGLLARQRVPPQGTARRAQAELGVFAGGRLDPARFAAVFAGDSRLDETALDRIEAAAETLAEVLEWVEELYLTQVEPGHDLRATVRSALAVGGRAFAAGRAAEAARTGRYSPSEHDLFVHGFPQRRWSRAERLTAPPLVVEVDGADLQVAGLAELMDGALKLVLLVRGPCAPAPLARLITPGVGVAQVASVEAIERLGDLMTSDAPAVVALVPDGCARFVHRPAAAGQPGELVVEHLPAEAPRGALAGYGVFQQHEELRLLSLLAAATAAPHASPGPTNGAAAAPVEPADKLAAWLLKQAHLPEPA